MEVGGEEKGERIATGPEGPRNDRTEQRRTDQTVADGLADGRFEGIDIMPEEGEEAISSPNGFTEEGRQSLYDTGTGTRCKKGVASQILCKLQIAVKNRAKVYGLAGRPVPPALPTE